MNITKPLTKILGLCLLGLSGFVVVSNSNSQKVDACDFNIPAKKAVDYGFDIAAGEPETFKVVSLSSNSTETSHSLSLKFSSSTSYLYTSTGNYKGVFIASEDSSCPNDTETAKLTTKYDFDPNSPKLSYVECDEEGNPVLTEEGKYNFIPDKDGITHNYTGLISTYEGYVYRFEPSESAEIVAVPYIVNRFDRYKLKVTSISSNSFNYTVTSLGKQNDNVKSKLTKIFVGPNITRVDSEAFKVTDEHVNQFEINFIGSQSSITFGENWTNVTRVNFDYDLDNPNSGLTATQVKELKQVYDLDIEKDDNGNPVYYDELGYIIDAEGNYLKVEGKDPYEGEPQTKDAAKVISFNTKSSKSSDKSFVFGAPDLDRPMVLEYQVEKEGQPNETRYYEFTLDENTRGVGSLAGKKEQILYCDFHINQGEKVDDDSFVIRNLFESELTQLQPVIANEFAVAPIRGYTNSFALEDFISRKDWSVKTFGGYTAFTVKVDKVAGIYEKVNPVSWKAYQAKVEAGEMKIRYSFVGFNTSTYRLTFVKNGELVTKEVGFVNSSKNGITLTFHLLTKNKNNEVTFLIKNSLIDEDFSASSVRRVEYKALSFKLDLMSTKKGTSQTVTKSAVVSRFGYYDILPMCEEAPSKFNGLGLVEIGALIYLLGYVAYTFIYYTYAKKAFKNDEFRRMDDKKYFKKMGIILIESLFIVIGLLFTIVRFSSFNTSVIVYNPVDPFVIAFDFVAIIMIGIFAKNIIVFTKATKARNEARRLKLDEDVAEDGTK